MRLVPSVLLAFLVLACGSSPNGRPRSAAEAESDAFYGPPEGASESVSVPPWTEVQRRDVDEVLKGGLGRFLQEVELGAEIVEGKFVGFRIERFRDPRKWEGVGLEVGDVVTRVNELPIERDTQAYEAFLALKTRKSLDVVYLRHGIEMHLSFPIVGESAPASAPAAAVAPAPAAAPAATEKAAPKSPR